MLAQALVLSRDLQLVGEAGQVLRAPPQPAQWNKPQPPRRKEPIEDLQPNIRGMLADREALQGIGFSTDKQTDPEQASVNYRSISLVTLHRPVSAVFKDQCRLVLSYADLRGERTNEILSQVVPQVAFWSAIAGLQPERHRYTYELLGAALRFANMVVQRLKLSLDVPRAMEYSPLVQPMLLAPGHRSFPSGHSTEAHCAAEVLSALSIWDRQEDLGWGLPLSTPPGGTPDPSSRLNCKDGLRYQMLRLAYRVAENRVVAGLHYPMDSMAGQVLGIMLAHQFLWRIAQTPGNPNDRMRFYAKAIFKLEAEDSSAEPILDLPLECRGMTVPKDPAQEGKSDQPEAAPVLDWLFKKARCEWGYKT
jgi:hypothetical protein